MIWRRLFWKTTGAVKPSFVASELEALRLEGSEDDVSIKQIGAAALMMYIAGAETINDDPLYEVNENSDKETQ